MTAASTSQESNDAALELRQFDETVVARVGLTCLTACDGRRAVRALAGWAGRFKLNEPEFQVLWCLRSPSSGGLDQTTLARWLAFSPAQVSATVERLRTAGWIVSVQPAGDRRRNLWRLSDSGRLLLEEMLAAAGYLQFEPAAAGVELPLAKRDAREAAA